LVGDHSGGPATVAGMTTTEEALRDRHRPAHAQRTAASHAAFLLPHLSPGQPLLDIGCGPGTITSGLATAVAPAVAVGLDLDPAAPVSVRADALALPFPTGTFDAIFIRAVLQHLPDPVAALVEARRVARPGAVIGVADADWGGYLLSPTNPLLEASLTVLSRARRGSAFIGRTLRGLLVAAGFSGAVGMARTMPHGDPEEVRGLASFNASFFDSPALVEMAVRSGWASPDELAAMGAAWRTWGEEPGGFFAGFWCEALAWA
jgi:ubiquinone/menaquinone biosynthesis C-methylase UbiE